MGQSSTSWILRPWIAFAIAMMLAAAPVTGEAQTTYEVPHEWPGGDVAPSGELVPPGQLHGVPADTYYWAISSRGLTQEASNCRSAHLGYYRRECGGPPIPASREEMLGHLIPGVPICIFIHGSFVDSSYHIRESAQTYDWIRRAAPHLPAHLLFYTWPSEARHNYIAPLNPIAVNQRGRWAENNAFYLADLIAHLPHESPICLVGHSHGARVAIATLHLIAGGQVSGKTYPYDTGCNRRYRAVMAAGAIDRHWLNPGQRYDFALHRVEGILNLVNHTDTALHLYPLLRPFSRKAIATTGLTRWDRARLGPLANRMIDYDVTELIGLGHFWPNYFEEPTLATAISPYVYFTDRWLNPTYGLPQVSSDNVQHTE